MNKDEGGRTEFGKVLVVGSVKRGAISSGIDDSTVVQLTVTCSTSDFNPLVRHLLNLQWRMRSQISEFVL